MISTLKKKERSIRIMGNQLYTGERVGTGFSGKVEVLKQAKGRDGTLHAECKTILYRIF